MRHPTSYHLNYSYVKLCLGWTLKIARLPSPDRPNVGGVDSKFFIGPLKRKQNFECSKHFLRQLIILTLSFTFQIHVSILLNT